MKRLLLLSLLLSSCTITAVVESLLVFGCAGAATIFLQRGYVAYSDESKPLQQNNPPANGQPAAQPPQQQPAAAQAASPDASQAGAAAPAQAPDAQQTPQVSPAGQSAAAPQANAQAQQPNNQPAPAAAPTREQTLLNLHNELQRQEVQNDFWKWLKTETQYIGLKYRYTLLYSTLATVATLLGFYFIKRSCDIDKKDGHQALSEYKPPIVHHHEAAKA